MPQLDAGRDRGALIEERVDARALLTALIDSTSDLIWSVDSEHFALQAANRALREYFREGRDLDIRPGMMQEELFPTGELAERWKGFYRRALHDGPYSLEYETTMAGLVLELHFTLLEDEGRVFGITVFGRDITARRRAAEELRRSEAFFRSLQQASPDLAAVIGPDGRYRFVSAACAHIVGYTVEEMLSAPAGSRIHPDERERMARAFERVLARDGHVERQRFRIRHRDGSWRHLEVVAQNQSSNPDVRGVLLNSRDVTEQVLLAARVQHVREEEKARIARDLHDELGSLLTGLKLDVVWLEERLEELPPTPALNSLVERAVAASELVERTIAEVQQIATDLRPAALDRLGLGPALRQEARRFQRRSGISCSVDLSERLPPMPPDAATALYRIAQEALTNVARHARASHAVLRLDARGDGVVLVIEDDGIGIDEAHVSQDATALGLAGMRQRAALEGGELMVGRRAEGGTRVEARLPVGTIDAAVPG